MICGILITVPFLWFSSVASFQVYLPHINAKKTGPIKASLLTQRCGDSPLPAAKEGLSFGVEDPDKWIRLSSESLKQFTGESLLKRMGLPDSDSAELLDVHNNTRYAVLSHGTEDDPIFCYFNRAAKESFRYYDDNEIYRIPSRLSAPAGEARNVRQSQVAASLHQDIREIRNAVRVSKMGELFVVQYIILWNVYDHSRKRVGQTALYDRELMGPYCG